MKLFDKLDNENFEAYAISNYRNPSCTTMDEFSEDLSRFKYLKKLINRYLDSDDFQPRLILNHLIVLFNVFESRSVYRMLRFKMNELQLSIIKPFLDFLGHLGPNDLVEIPPNPHAKEMVQTL